MEFKRDQAKIFGATHAAPDVPTAQALITDLTRGVMADACIITTDVAEAGYVAEALSPGWLRKVIVTAIGHPTELTIGGSLFELTLYEKSIHGHCSARPTHGNDIRGTWRCTSWANSSSTSSITREYTSTRSARATDMLEGATSAASSATDATAGQPALTPGVEIIR